MNNTNFTTTEIAAIFLALQNIQNRFRNRRRLAYQQFLEEEEAFWSTHLALIRHHQLLILAESQLLLSDINFLCYLGMPQYLEEAATTRQALDGGNSYDWWTYHHPNLNDGTGPNSFRAHYRVNRATFEFIVNTLNKNPELTRFDAESDNHPVWKQVAFALWRFSNTHVGHVLADEIFGTSHASYVSFMDKFVDGIMRCLIRYAIQWPATIEQCQKAMAGFSAPSGRTDSEHLKECIGAADGKLIIFKKPAESGDRNVSPSMSLMAVCDHKRRFTKIFTGVPGNRYDIHMFSRSRFYNDLMHHSHVLFKEPSAYVIGDSKFGLMKNCLVPYRRKTGLTDGETKFNKALSSTKLEIENAFGLLAVRWGFMYRHSFVLSEKGMAKAIAVCCILHNLCIKFGDTQEYLTELLQQDGGSSEVASDNLLDWHIRTDNVDGAEISVRNSASISALSTAVKATTGTTPKNRFTKEGGARRDEVMRSL